MTKDISYYLFAAGLGADVLTTIIGVSIGLSEGNPLGVYSVVFVSLMLIVIAKILWERFSHNERLIFSFVGGMRFMCAMLNVTTIWMVI